MSTEAVDVFTQALALPVTQRVQLAQRLWESLGPTESSADSDDDVIEVARRRDDELSKNPEVRRTHQEVMRAARDAIQ